MATYRVTSPNGETFEITAPEGASESQVMAYAKSQFVSQKQTPEQPRQSGSFVDPLMQGLTWGWADELGGLGARLGAGLAGAGSERRDQVSAQEIDRQRSRLSSYRDENPWTSTGLEITGSLAGGLPLAKFAKTGWQLAGQGIGSGALAGMGSADEEKALGAALGGVTGGLLAGAVPATQYLARKGGNYVADTARSIYGRFADEPQTRAGRIMAEQFRAGGLSPAALQSSARQLGPQATVAEIAGEPGIAMGQALIKRDPTGAARQVAARELGKRTPGMSNRLRTLLADTTGVSERLQPTLDAVRKRQQAIAADTYSAANAQEIPLTGRLKNLLMRPPMQRAFKAAKEAAETRGESLPPWFKMNDMGEWEKVGVIPDMPAWDRMKQGIDRLIDAETDSITGRMSPAGRDLTIMKNQLLEELDKINPAYATAREMFAGDEAIQGAMRHGERFLTMKTRDVHQAVKGMSQSERESFLTGAVEAIRERIGRSRSGEMGSFNFLEKDNAIEKLRAVFPPGRDGQKAISELMRGLRKERVLRETENALLRGSQTSLRDAAGDALGVQSGMPTAAETLASPMRSGAQAMVSKVLGTLWRERQPTIDAMTELLLTPGKANDVIAEMRRRGIPQETINQYLNSVSRGSAAIAPGAGGLAGSLGN